MMYVENAIESTENQLELISKHSKASEYNISICKFLISPNQSLSLSARFPTKYPRLGGLNNRHVFLTGLEVRDQGVSMVWFS